MRPALLLSITLAALIASTAPGVQAPVAGGREPAQPFVITDVTLIGPVGSRGGGARLSKDGAEE
jgi:hypothetical protein